jgi:molybdenum cofactor cytidylyltransferase
MGRPKPLLPWGEHTLIEYQLREFKASHIDGVIAVLGHRAEEVRAKISDAKVQVVVNKNYLQGRATSVKAGARALPPDTSAIVIQSVDQPRPRSLLDALIETHLSNDNLITVPTHKGRRGHPPVFSGYLIPELCNVSEERQGLREIMQQHASEISELPWDSDVVLLGMNTPEEYRQALERYPFEK